MPDIHFADNLTVLRPLPPGQADLIDLDPPFNTGQQRRSTRVRVSAATEGDRTGFGGRRYVSVQGATRAFDDYLGFLEPRLREAHRVLAPHGTLYFHIDREVHYCKVLLDGIFGRSCFLNDVIWTYDYGGRTRKR